MMNAGNAWLLAILGLLWTGLLIFRRFRRRTEGYAEVRAFKERLPGWAAGLEQLIWICLTIVIAVGLSRIVSVVQRAANVGHPITGGAAAGLYLVGISLIAAPLAMLGSNWISQIVPPLRVANQRAMSGSGYSYRRANLGLLKFATASIPIGLLVMGAALAQPWA